MWGKDMSSAPLRSAGAPRRNRKVYFREYYLRTLEARREYARQYHARNRAKRNAQLRARRQKPEEKAKLKAARDAYYAKHREELIVRYRARYHAKKVRRNPMEAARRLVEKATQAAKLGYMGKLTPGGI